MLHGAYSGAMFIFKGLLGIIFGILLIAKPDFMKGAFLTLVTVILIIACFISFFFAVTSRQTDTLFWFLVSVGMIILIILSLFFSDIFAAIFAIVIAGWALITSVWELNRFMCSQRRFYAIIAGLIIASLALITLAFYFVPSLHALYLTTICGNFALVFGIFALVFGLMLLRGRVPTCLMPAQQKP